MLVVLNLLVLLTIIGCKSTPEYIYIQPECSIPQRIALSEVDAGVLYDVLTLPQALHPKDTSTLLPQLPIGYDGHVLYWTLKDNHTKLVDMILEREAVLNKLCKVVDNGIH